MELLKLDAALASVLIAASIIILLITLLLDKWKVLSQEQLESGFLSSVVFLFAMWPAVIVFNIFYLLTT